MLVEARSGSVFSKPPKLFLASRPEKTKTRKNKQQEA
jgi:hypothetical protein